jgi:hypothetical protein
MQSHKRPVKNMSPKISDSYSKTSGIIKVKIKVNFTLEQATKAQRKSRGIALLFL